MPIAKKQIQEKTSFPDVPDLLTEQPEFYDFLQNWICQAECHFETVRPKAPIGFHNRPGDVSSEFALPIHSRLWQAVNAGQVFSNFYRFLLDNHVSLETQEQLERLIGEQKDRLNKMAGKPVSIASLLAGIGIAVPDTQEK